MVSIRIDVLVKYLKAGARSDDKKIFNEWMYKKIDTSECIRQFRINNNITERMPIIEEEFETWLGSLGYKR